MKSGLSVFAALRRNLDCLRRSHMLARGVPKAFAPLRGPWSFLFVRNCKQACLLPNKKAPVITEGPCAQNWIAFGDHICSRGVPKAFAPLRVAGIFISPHLQASLLRSEIKMPLNFVERAFVPRTGFEPAHPCERCDLNTVRLPISPPGQFRAANIEKQPINLLSTQIFTYCFSTAPFPFHPVSQYTRNHQHRTNDLPRINPFTQDQNVPV